MEELVDNDNLSIHWDHTRSFMLVKGKKESIKVPSEIGRQAVLKLMELIRTLQPKFLLINDKERTYVYSVEEQRWVARTFSKACEDGRVQKCAFIKPTELIQELSTIQTIEEVDSYTFDFKYVDSVEEGIHWFGFE